MTKSLEKSFSKLHYENEKLKKDNAWYEKAMENLSATFKMESDRYKEKLQNEHNSFVAYMEKSKEEKRLLEEKLCRIPHLEHDIRVLKDEMKNKHCLFTKVEIHVGEGYTQTQIALRPDNNIAQTLTLLATYTKDQHEAKFENTEPDFSEDNYRVLPLFQKFIVEDLCDQLGYELHIDEGDV
mgnify:FL=1